MLDTSQQPRIESRIAENLRALQRLPPALAWLSHQLSQAIANALLKPLLLLLRSDAEQLSKAVRIVRGVIIWPSDGEIRW